MSTIRNKQRLIHLYRYLMKYTDEENQATTNDLVDFLRREDANASRKTVKDDIEVLLEEGVDIVVNKSFYNSYFVGSRKFEEPEIRILAEGIASNRSISKEKKEELIDKLLSLLSIYQAGKIRKHLRYSNNLSLASEQLYYNVDRITKAIDKNNKIEFFYNNSVGERASGKDEEKKSIVLTPIAIRSSREHFYLCGYRSAAGAPEIYRLDRMTRTRILEDEGDVCMTEEEISRILNSLFDMGSGELTAVTLECSDELADMIRDKFGKEAEIWRSTRKSFYIRTLVCVSPAFYSWVFRYSPMIRIVSPEKICGEYAAKIRAAADAAKHK